MSQQTIKATITKNAKKLWSCENFKLITPEQYHGQLPKSAGEEIILYSPGETPSSICSGKRSWKVAVVPKSQVPGDYRGYKVCEHQVDLPRKK
jgi:hypothetical protein